MQKWARLNIRRPRTEIAHHRTSGAEQLTVRVAIDDDYQRVNPEVLQQRIEGATNGRALPQWKTSRIHRQMCLESSSEDEIVATPKHIIKPPKFDGQSSFEAFMAQFSNCAKHNKYNEAQKLAYLRNSLEKEAAYVLWDYRQHVIGFLSGLMKTLETTGCGKKVIPCRILQIFKQPLRIS